MPDRVAVVGVAGDDIAKEAARAIDAAEVVVGTARLLDRFAVGRRTIRIGGDIPAVLDAIAAESGAVCVLASGDPGFFGIVRPLAERFGRDRIDVHPAPSSVALAFARLGMPWDDAVVVSAHGRPVDAAGGAAAASHKAAILTSPDAPPEAVGAALLQAGAPHDHAAVVTAVGTSDEAVVETDLAGLASGRFDPLSVVVVWRGNGVPPEKTLAWGLPETAFARRGSMITKAEVRAVALGKLALPATGTVWDVGAGSGSVAIECALVAPGARVVAIERDAAAVADLRENASAHGVAVDVVHGEAPAALAPLPEPDRAFVGGGGIDVLEAVLDRLRPGGSVVAAYAAMDRAAAAFRRLGHLVEVSVSRAATLPDGGVRLAAENPVFVAWGPA